MRKIISVFLLGMLSIASTHALPKCGCSDNLSKQIECDESKNDIGPSKCLNECDCSKGRKCVFPKHHYPHGQCEDKKS